MNEIWYTSDLHFGHANIIEYCKRPFDSVEHMNEQLIENFNEIVHSSDLIYFLGDIGMGDRYATIPLIKRLNGKKVLLPGNHDNCWIGNQRRREKWQQLYRDCFDAVINANEVYQHWNSQITIKLCHFPTVGDSCDQDRYSKWRPSLQDNEWLLAGHVHDAWRIDIANRTINVGVDVNDYRPVNKDVIKAQIESFKQNDSN